MCPRYGPGWVYYLTQDLARPLAYYFEGYKRDAIVPGEGGRWQLRSKTGDSLLTLQPYTSGGNTIPSQNKSQKRLCPNFRLGIDGLPVMFVLIDSQMWKH